MGKFDRAYYIAVISKSGAMSATLFWACYNDGSQSQKQVERDLERLVAEGELIRTEHGTCCRECGADSGVEYRYDIERGGE